MTRLQRAFIWLGGASGDTLHLCGPYERMKYAALGATLLVPAAAGLLAGYYTIHSLSQSPLLAGVVAVLWSLALVVIDRAILITYRKGKRQAPGVVLRMAIAGLAGILIAHMLVLFVFRDQIEHKISQTRQETISQVTQAAQDQIRLARQTEEARNASAIKAKEEQIRALRGDREGLFFYPHKGARDRLLQQKDMEIAAAYHDLDDLHSRQSYDEAKRVEARLAADVEKERRRTYDDVLSRTSALHDVISARASLGDYSPMIAYGLLVLLLFCLDTLPIAIKILLPLDTYERVLTRTLQDIENRLLLEAEEQWQMVQVEIRRRIDGRKLLTQGEPVPEEVGSQAPAAP